MPVVRHRHRRRSARGGAGLKPAGTTTALLRPALEAAVAVARDGERATPPVMAPGPLRRYLSFARLPDPALEVAKRVLDDDDGFRARVAAAVDEDVVGRAGWVFLTRPDGWQAEVDALRKEAAASDAASREERAERSAQRRLAGAESAAARAETARLAAVAETERLRTELEQQRAAAGEATAEVARLAAELDRVEGERSASVRRLKELERVAADRGAELRAMRHELRMAQAELAAADTAAPATGSGSAGAVAAPAEPAVDAAAVADALADALAALRAVEASVGAAAQLVGAGASATPDDGVSRASGRTRRARPLRGRGRRPVDLPPGILDDSPEAAQHVVRAPGALVLVDGYNISHAQWYGRGLAEQRERLLGACAELHARAGVEVEVVFDGSGEAETIANEARAGVRHRFTTGGAEADDVILARVDEEPPERPVVVVSSDRRVRDGARERGANVLGARQFLGLVRR